jgi:chemotaxis protein CheC
MTDQANRETAATAFDPNVLTELHMDALREVGNIGAGTAASSLSTMTGQPVAMAVPRASLVPIEEVPEMIGNAEDVVAAIYMGVIGDAPGHIMFVMPTAVAHAVCDLLLGGMPAGELGISGFSEMQLSALQEVGNILTGSYLRALADLTGLHLEPTPPALGIDMVGALLGAVMSEVSRTSDLALMIETAFGDDTSASVGQFIYVPDSTSVATVLGGLGMAA